MNKKRYYLKQINLQKMYNKKKSSKNILIQEFSEDRLTNICTKTSLRI
jgi:hypothetical protein